MYFEYPIDTESNPKEKYMEGKKWINLVVYGNKINNNNNNIEIIKNKKSIYNENNIKEKIVNKI